MTSKVDATFQFPIPGDDATVLDVCHWIVRVRTPGERGFSFAASILSYVVKYGGATEKQAEAIADIFETTIDDFIAGRLAAQGGPVPEAPAEDAKVVSISQAREKRT